METIDKQNNEKDSFSLFMEDFLQKVIHNTINNIALKDIPKKDRLDGIIVNKKVRFLRRFKDTPVIFLYDDDNSISILLPDKNYEEAKEQFVAFLKQQHMIKDFSTETDVFEINSSLSSLISAYGQLSNDAKLLLYADSGISYLESRYADNVHAKMFEEEFLDKYVLDIIKRAKRKNGYLEQKCYDKLNEGQIPVYDRIIMDDDPSDINAVLVVDLEELLSVFILVKSFMKDYNLGIIEFTSNMGIVIRFNTNLASLADAYNMEKQRIEYYTSGAYLSKDVDPQAKRIKPIR